MKQLTLAALPYASVITYGGCSLITSMLRRVIMTTFFFDYPIFISMTQVAATLFVLELSKFLNVVNVQSYTVQRGREMFLPSFLYTFASYISMNAIEGVSMPMFVPVKCFCPLAVLFFTKFILRRPLPSSPLLCAVFILCLGSSTANVFEFAWEQWSYLFGVVVIIVQAASFVIIEDLSQRYSALDLLYVNSFNSLVLFLLADLFEDEIQSAMMFFFTAASATFITAFIVVVVLGVLVQLSLFYSICYASSLALAITANVRSAFQVFMSYLFSVYAYYDIIPGLSNMIGLLITLGAAIAVFRTNNQHFQRSSNVFKC